MAEDIYWTPPPSPKQDIYWEPPTPPPLPLPPPQPPVDTRSTFQKFLDWAGEPTLPEAEPYPVYKTRPETIPDMFDPSKTRDVNTVTNEPVPYSNLKKFANDIVFEPYNQLIRPVSAPLGLAALAVEGGAGLYGRYKGNQAINAAAEAYRQKPKVSVEYLRGLNARPDVVEPPIDVQATPTYTGPRQLQGIGPEEVPPMTETYNGPRQLGAAVHSNLPASTERYSGPRQAPPRLALPAQGETGLRTFYQGPAGTTIEGQDYPVDTSEPGRVSGGYDPVSPVGTLANLPAIDVAQRGQKFGQLASSVASDFGEPEPFPQPEVNYPISTQLEQQPEQTGLQPVEPVTQPEPKPIATNPLYEIRQEGGGKYSVINTVTGSALVSSTTPETAQIVFDAVKGKEKPGTEPTPTPKSVTLYRWQANPGKGVPEWMQSSPEYQKSKAAEGGWYTEKPENLDFYKQDAPDGRIVTIQVTPEEAAKYKVTNNPEAAKFSRDPNTEYYIPSQALSQIKPVESVSPEPRRVPATLTTGSVNLSEVENPERPFQVSTQPIDFPRQPEPPPDEPGQPPSLDRLPTAEKPQLRPGGEVTERPAIQPPFRTDTLTPEEARALKGETTPVQPSGGPLPPFRVDTLTPEEAQAVRGQPEFEPAPTHMQPESTRPVSPVGKSYSERLRDAGRRVYEEASRTGERLTDDEIRQRVQKLMDEEAKPTSQPTSSTPPTSPDVGVPFRKETLTGDEGSAAFRASREADINKAEARAARARKKYADEVEFERRKAKGEGAKPVEPVETDEEPVLKAGQSKPDFKDIGNVASHLSPDKALKNHPWTKGIYEVIRNADEKGKTWVNDKMREMAPFVPKMLTNILDRGKASSIRIGKLLDGLDVPGASDFEKSAAAGIRKVLDKIYDEAKMARPDMGHISHYFTHMAPEKNVGILKGTWDFLFHKENLAKTAEGTQGDLLDKGLGNPSSPYVEPRTGQLQDIDYDIRRVLPKYINSISKEIFAKPAVEQAKVLLDQIPKTESGVESKLKSTAGWFIKNFNRYDSEAGLSKAYRDYARTLATMFSRAYTDWNLSLHVLHFGAFVTRVVPELGEKWASVGVYKLLTNPHDTWYDMARAGMIYGDTKPFAFKTVSERYQSAAQLFNLLETFAKGSAYKGEEARLISKGVKPDQAKIQALRFAKTATFDTSTTNQMRLGSPESKLMGGQIGSILGNLYRSIPTKVAEYIGETSKNFVASPYRYAAEAIKRKYGVPTMDAAHFAELAERAKSDPIKAARMAAYSTLAIESGLHMFHLNLGSFLKMTPIGPAGPLFNQLGQDLFVKHDADAFFKHLIYGTVPGGRLLEDLVEPPKPVSKGSQNIPSTNPVGSVLGGGLQAKGAREVQPVS